MLARKNWHASAVPYVGALVLLAAAYVVTGRLGLAFAEHQSNATLVWAPTGISLAALVLYGRRLWPGVFVAALLVNLSLGTPLLVSVGIAIGNTLEALTGAAILAHFSGFEPGFGRATDCLRYLLAAVLCSMVSASVGIGSLLAGALVEPGGAALAWLDWWLGDLGGAIIVGPIVLVSLRGRPSFASLARRAETWVALAMIAVTTALAFGDQLALELRLPVALAAFPLLLWAGLRLGPRGAMLGAAIVAVVAFTGSAATGGAFVGSFGLYLTLAYVATAGAMAGVLAAAIAERELAEERQTDERDERHRVEAQLHRQRRLEELSVLAGGVAHDFNNLLVPIYANAELLRSAVGEDNRPLADDILVAAGEARVLSDWLLAYAGKRETSLEALDVGGLVASVGALVASSLGTNVKFVSDLRARPFVRADAALLREVIVSLVLNASEAIGDRSGTIRVVLDVESEGDCAERAVVRVIDDGCGMDAATRERLFDPFFTTKRMGRGLGLSAVAGIVQLHHGAIEVESAKGEGTTFRLLLPTTVAPALQAGHDVPGDLAPRATKTVLVADDDAAVRRTVIRVLSDAGYDIIAAVDGQDALEQFERHGDRVALALLDVTMPHKAGTEVAVEIRRRSPGMPVVLMSGFSQGLRADDAAASLPFVAKPFTGQELCDALERALETGGRARLEIVR